MFFMVNEYVFLSGKNSGPPLIPCPKYDGKCAESVIINGQKRTSWP